MTLSIPKIISSPERDIYLISDTHFNHENIIKYCDRPFKNADEMNWHMVEKWNSVIKPGDKVYHLGDVYMGGGFSREYTENLLSKLNGQKRLILGNHDNGKDQILQKYFQKIDVWRMFPEFGLLLTHVPVHRTALRRGIKDRPTNLNDVMLNKEESFLKNIHGHIHQNPSPDGPYRCVCVEQINYTPIHIEELRVK